VDPPTHKSIYEWDKTLRETGSLISHTGKHPKQHVMEETVNCVRESFSRSSCKSIRQASRELGVPHSTVHDKRLRLCAYKHPKQHMMEETVDRVRESFSRSPHSKSIKTD
jgi:transposase